MANTSMGKTKLVKKIFKKLYSLFFKYNPPKLINVSPININMPRPKLPSMYIPLPLPKTSIEKWCMYLNIGRDLEMVLYDGKFVYTPDFPDIPIEQIVTEDNRVITQQTLQTLCAHIMKITKVSFNKEYNIWEAISDCNIKVTY